MFSRLKRLFSLYCDHHFEIPMPGFPIMDGDGAQLGHVDRVSFAQNSIRLEGWSTAEKVAFGAPGKTSWQRPDIERADVATTLSLKAGHRTGFSMTWHGVQNGVLLSLRSNLTTLQIVCPQPSRFARFVARIHVKARFMRDFVKALPVLVAAYLKPSPDRKSHAKRALGMRIEQANFILDSKIFRKSKLLRAAEKITIIMPVFNAFDVLQDALERVLDNTDLPSRFILIEDCSTDKRIRPMLRDWVSLASAQGHDILLLENTRNLGFIQSVNRGFNEALKHKGHVVLLNSDALVPRDWAGRLLHPMIKDTRIASVTPMSNDAEIFTAPICGQRSNLKVGIADQIDLRLKNSVSSDSYAQAPTGVGFCMAINRKFLKKFPEFDTDFGRGYGEEVDWCQKTALIGGQHVVQPSLFVEHRGGASFGESAKQVAISRNNHVISSRYPRYDRAVQDFVETDPIRTARLIIACQALSARQESVKIFIGHSLGGGAELYLREKIQSNKLRSAGTIVLRVGGPLRWRIEVHDAHGLIYGDTDDDEMMMLFADAVPNRHIIYSCAVGDKDPLGFTSNLVELVQRHASRFTFLVHDYFAVSPSYCLLDSDEVYRPKSILSSIDTAHTSLDRKGASLSTVRWRLKWLRVLQLATEIECFSTSSTTIIKKTFPSLTAPIVVKPHIVANVKRVPLLARHTPQSLGILGDIGVQKGAKCVVQLSNEIQKSQFSRMTLVGRLDPRFLLANGSVETGSYNRSDISTLAEQHNISAWFIPSIWPETFSYTTHEALATGLPVFCFDIGAQKDAVRNASNGWLLPLEWADKPKLILDEMAKVLSDDTASRRCNCETKKTWNRGSAA